ncbi:MAG: TIGR02444 family protein, partial [Kiloniellales bacterium]
MAAELDNPFWDFSLAVWGREAVAPACLALQERHGLDVNLLLFCGWAGRRGRALAAADIERLIEAARPWREA